MLQLGEFVRVSSSGQRAVVRRALVWISSLAFGCSGASTQQETLGIEQPVIYGVDDRAEVYAESSDSVGAVASESMLALIPNRRLVRGSDGRWDLASRSAGERHGLCPGEPFASQPAAADCTATLVAADLVMTAGHCVWSPSSCRSYAFVFNYSYSAPSELRTIDDNAVYQCEELVFSETALSGEAPVDLAVVRLDRKAVGFTPVRVASRKNVSLGSAIVLVGTPEGVPIKIDRGGSVQSYVGQPSTGFTANVDAFSGSSGSGVFSANGQLIGVLSGGQNDLQPRGECQVTRRLENSEGQESIFWAELAIDELCGSPSASTSLCPPAVEQGIVSSDLAVAGSNHEADTTATPAFGSHGCNLAAHQRCYGGWYWLGDCVSLLVAATLRKRDRRKRRIASISCGNGRSTA